MLLFYLYAYLEIDFLFHYCKLQTWVALLSIMCCNRLIRFYRKHINWLLNSASLLDNHKCRHYSVATNVEMFELILFTRDHIKWRAFRYLLQWIVVHWGVFIKIFKTLRRHEGKRLTNIRQWSNPFFFLLHIVKHTCVYSNRVKPYVWVFLHSRLNMLEFRTTSRPWSADACSNSNGDSLVHLNNILHESGESESTLFPFKTKIWLLDGILVCRSNSSCKWLMLKNRR